MMTTTIITPKTVSKVYVIDISKVASSSLNPLGSKVRCYILDELNHACTDSEVTSIVLTGGTKNFSAGADLLEFSTFVSPIPTTTTSIGTKPPNGTSNTETKLLLSSHRDIPSLIDVVDAIEKCTKPVIAAITGACLGGGLEVALACHYRIATISSQLGLPEVHVGVIPGAGGTQRLPRLIGLQKAIQMIVTGQPIKGGYVAKEMKLVDDIVDPYQKVSLLDFAKKWALWAEVIDPTLDSRRLSKVSIQESPHVAHGILHAASLAIPKPEHGGEGMHAALEAIRASTTTSSSSLSSSFERGMDIERELFLQTLFSEQGKARRHSFFATRKCQKPMYPILVTSSINNPLLQDDVSTVAVGVVGAGTMGGGIALVLLQTGYKVYLTDINDSALKKGVDLIHKTIQSYIDRKRLSSTKAANMLSPENFIATSNLSNLASCQLIVEAVVENMNIKHKIFSTLDQITCPDCILVSNTSTLDIDFMSTAVHASRRQYFAGWHFFSPAHVMKLVEIVVGKNCTSPETVTLLQLLTKKIKKIGVVVGNCDGFCGNRMLKPYSSEMVLLLTEHSNNTIQSIDYALQQVHGFALGPFQMSDLAGNDIGYNVRLARGWVRTKDNVPTNRPPRYTEMADDMVSELGRLGQKVGKGWYDYNPDIGNGRVGLRSEEMECFIQKYYTNNSTQRVFTSDEIIQQVLYPLVNEGFKILEEDIARSPSDIDVVWLYGYGWPAWKGGPMYWADHIVGLSNLLQKLQEFHTLHPDTEHFIPSVLLCDCVERNLTVEEYYAKGLRPTKEKKELVNHLLKSNL